VSVTVWHLEILDPAAFKRSATPLAYRLERVLAPSSSFLRYLYAATGADWHWTDRLPWTDAQWLARQADAAVEFWVAMDEGAPAGYFELARLDDGRSVELCYFGLMPHAVGKGQGGAMLTAAIDRMWGMGAGRIYVNTCSLDHPRALENYKQRGFTLFDTRQREQ
jgi:GNAT superfamily N-acetyltransferase